MRRYAPGVAGARGKLVPMLRCTADRRLDGSNCLHCLPAVQQPHVRADRSRALLDLPPRLRRQGASLGQGIPAGGVLGGSIRVLLCDHCDQRRQHVGRFVGRAASSETEAAATGRRFR